MKCPITITTKMVRIFQVAYKIPEELSAELFMVTNSQEERHEKLFHVALYSYLKKTGKELTEKNYLDVIYGFFAETLLIHVDWSSSKPIPSKLINVLMESVAVPPYIIDIVQDGLATECISNEDVFDITFYGWLTRTSSDNISIFDLDIDLNVITKKVQENKDKITEFLGNVFLNYTKE